MGPDGFRLSVSLGMMAVGLLLWVGGPAHAAGAIAIGPCGKYGYAYDRANLAVAETAALRSCTHKDCRLVATIRRACAAVAVDMKNACGSHGYAVAPRLGKAQNTALQQCYAHGGKDCVIRAFACDAKN